MPRAQCACSRRGLHVNLLHAAENGVHGVLVTKPWNKNVTDLPKLIHRARSLYEVLDIVVKNENRFFGQN